MNFFKDHWLGIFVSSIAASLLAASMYEHVSLDKVAALFHGQNTDMVLVAGQRCSGGITNRDGERYRFTIYLTDVAAKIDLFGDKNTLLSQTFVDYMTGAGQQINNGKMIIYKDGKVTKVIPILSNGPHDNARSAVQSIAHEVIIDSSITCTRQSFTASSLYGPAAGESGGG